MTRRSVRLAASANDLELNCATTDKRHEPPATTTMQAVRCRDFFITEASRGKTNMDWALRESKDQRTTYTEFTEFNITEIWSWCRQPLHLRRIWLPLTWLSLLLLWKKWKSFIHHSIVVKGTNRKINNSTNLLLCGMKIIKNCQQYFSFTHSAFTG